MSFASSILSTRSAVGGTMGSPSLSFSRQNQSLTASRLSSTSIMGEVKFIVKDSNRIVHERTGEHCLPLMIFSFPLAGKD